MPDKLTSILFYRAVDNEGFFGLKPGFIEDKVKEFQDAEGDILFRINSPGGYVMDGFTLIQHIKEAKSKGLVNMIVDGYACSMGGMFLAYGDNVSISSLGEIMLHKAYVNVDEDHPKFEEIQTRLTEMNLTLHNEFRKRIEQRGKDTSFLDGIFLDNEANKDFWFNAQSALDFGLVDEITNTNELKIAANIDLKEKYYNFYNTKREVITMSDEKKGKGFLANIFTKGDDSETFIKNLNEMINKIQEKITTGLSTISESVKSFDEKLIEIDAKQDSIILGIETGNTETNTKIEKVQANQDEVLSRLEALEVKNKALEAENVKLTEALELVTSNKNVDTLENDTEPKTKAQEKKELTNDLIGEIHAHSGINVQN